MYNKIVTYRYLYINDIHMRKCIIGDIYLLLYYNETQAMILKMPIQ